MRELAGQRHGLCLKSSRTRPTIPPTAPIMGREMMRDRQNTLLWIKDLIEHMNLCQEQLQWAADGPTASFLTEAMLVDLSECRRLCEQLRAAPRQKALLTSV